MITGFSLLAISKSISTATRFDAINPATGAPTGIAYHAASPDEVAAAAQAAAAAFETYRQTSLTDRAAFLDRCAANIAELGDLLIQTASSETGLAAPRLAGERDRTVNQFRYFANLIREASWVDAVIDHGDPNRTPMPKPDLRRMRRPLGPIAVFGASNFPLAYSAGGGDTASALAAGCPVIVKGHPSHPGTGELVAAAITRAVQQSGLPTGTYSYLHAGGSRELEVGKELITHPAIKAAGFTGSLNGGMALARLGASRPDPIPVFSEMGSVNPVFILPGALEKDHTGLAQRLHASFTNSTGQMCTCPGLVFVVRSPAAESFIRLLDDLTTKTDVMTMLSPKIRESFLRRLGEIEKIPAVRRISGGPHERSTMQGDHDGNTGAFGRPTLLITDFAAFKQHHTLREECFGPETLVVVCDKADDLIAAAGIVEGSLTGTISIDAASASDTALAARIQSTLEPRVGRLIFNGVPTGVEVASAMVHGGPYPATNQPNSSAVGSLALQRWCRPVCFQDCPDSLLPAELKEANPLGIRRLVDGRWA